MSVLLLECNVAGYRYYDGHKVWHSMREKDSLELRRERENPYDDRAVEVLWKGVKLGYIPKKDNSVIAQLIDRGNRLEAYIKELRNTPNPWERVHISVFLVL